MPNNILVTGANGFVGSHLVYHLSKQKGNHVVAMIRDEKQDLWTRTAQCNVIKVRVDLNRQPALEKLKRIISYYDINQIYHLASQSIVSRAQKNPLDTYYTNIMGTAKILEAARYIGGANVLYMSTDKVYGEGHTKGTTDWFQATEPYSSSKICGEFIIEDYKREFGMDIAVIRSCNIIGYDPYNPTRIVPKTIIKLLNNEKPIIYHTSHHGSDRQYVYINDVVELLIRYMDTPQIVNIGTPFILSPKEMIEQICELMGQKGHYDIRPIKFHEIKSQSMDFLTDFPFTLIDEALKETIGRFKSYYHEVASI